MLQKMNWKLLELYLIKQTNLTRTWWATLKKSKRKCFCLETRTRNLTKTMKISRKSTDNSRDNCKKLKRMSRDSWSRDKVFRTFRTSSLNSVEDPPQLPNSMEPLMKSETFLELLEWDRLKNSVTLVKWKSARPMMCQAGSRNFRKTKTREDELSWCNYIFYILFSDNSLTVHGFFN